jgi:hypothetical protein
MSAEGCAFTSTVKPGCGLILWELNDNNYYKIRYAYDIAILINGKFSQTVSEVLQTALGIVQQWCDNTNKTVTIPFTTKRDIWGLKEPTLFRKQSSCPVRLSTLD